MVTGCSGPVLLCMCSSTYVLSNCIVSISPVMHRCGVCQVSWGACEVSLDCSGAAWRAVVGVAAEMGLQIIYLLLFVLSKVHSVCFASGYEFVEGGSYLRVRKSDAGGNFFQNTWHSIAGLSYLMIFHLDPIRVSYVKTEGLRQSVGLAFCTGANFWFHIE